MSTIICNQCGVEIEVTAALQGQIEQQVLAAEHKKHQAELARVKAEVTAEAEAMAKQEKAATQELLRKKLEADRAVLMEQAKADLDIARQRLEAQLAGEQKKHAVQAELLIQSLKQDAQSLKDDSTAKDQANKQLREQLGELMQVVRQEKQARENAELEAQKKLAAEEAKIREEVQKSADEKQRLNLAARDKTISDLQKALDDAQRKAAQGSQQLQGEIMELDLERTLAEAWRDDDIAPVPKGVTGADIAHTVRTAAGNDCGLILWEIKRTKNWTDGWIPKLKQDVRSARAAVAIIVTEAMPKDLDSDIGQLQGIWICRPGLAIALGSLLRKGLLDVARQKVLADNRGGKAEALYNFITSHEFIQQVESMVETYGEMTLQVQKERVAYEKLWSQREKQAQKLLLSTATIVGSMQGYIGAATMPRIKGLELDDGLEIGDDERTDGQTTDGEPIPDEPQNNVAENTIVNPTLF